VERPSSELRTLAVAMLIIGFIAELVGIALLATGRSVPSAVSVMVPGLVLVMLGVIFIGQARRNG
jgi:hypothetical protein